MVPERWRRRADTPLGKADRKHKVSSNATAPPARRSWDILWTSVLGDSDGYCDKAWATSLYVRFTS
jgi:hypothetical protein